MNNINFNHNKSVPSKVVCIGRNYAKHIAELNNEIPDDMVVFIKPNSAISHTLCAFHGEGECREALHYEGELSFIIDDGYIAGVGFGLDLTKRALQTQLKSKQLPWERAKAFDGAAIFSDFVPLARGLDLSTLSLQLMIDDELKQEGGVQDMLFKPQTILNDLSRFMSLTDGDIIMTGTPEGVGVVNEGARFTGRVFLQGELLLESSWQAK